MTIDKDDEEDWNIIRDIDRQIKELEFRRKKYMELIHLRKCSKYTIFKEKEERLLETIHFCNVIKKSNEYLKLKGDYDV